MHTGGNDAHGACRHVGVQRVQLGLRESVAAAVHILVLIQVVHVVLALRLRQRTVHERVRAHACGRPATPKVAELVPHGQPHVRRILGQLCCEVRGQVLELEHVHLQRGLVGQESSSNVKI